MRAARRGRAAPLVPGRFAKLVPESERHSRVRRAKAAEPARFCAKTRCNFRGFGGFLPNSTGGCQVTAPESVVARALRRAWIASCAVASRATGTLNGEQET